MLHTLEQLRTRALADGECLLWQGATAGNGYGVVADDRERYVHRLVLLLDGRPVPDGQQGRHLCGRAACLNPAHLAVGDQSANEADKVATNTYNHGRPGVTHCGRYLDGGASRCRRSPHDGACEPVTDTEEQHA